jgi:hypothetical protein
MRVWLLCCSLVSLWMLEILRVQEVFGFNIVIVLLCRLVVETM